MTRGLHKRILRLERDFGGDFEQAVQLHRAPGDEMLERLAIQKFHGDEGLAVFLPDVVNCADIGMIQCGGGLGFPAKTLQGLAVLFKIFGQEFEGNKAVKASVLRLVHHTHPATAEFQDIASGRTFFGACPVRVSPLSARHPELSPFCRSGCYRSDLLLPSLFLRRPRCNGFLSNLRSWKFCRPTFAAVRLQDAVINSSFGEHKILTHTYRIPQII